MATFHKYTVVGFYVDNNQPLVEHRTAPDAQEAAKRVFQWYADEGHDIAIVEVFNGHLKGQLGYDVLLVRP